MFIPVRALGPWRGAALIRDERAPAAKFLQEAEFGGLRPSGRAEGSRWSRGMLCTLPSLSGMPGGAARGGIEVEEREEKSPESLQALERFWSKFCASLAAPHSGHGHSRAGRAPAGQESGEDVLKTPFPADLPQGHTADTRAGHGAPLETCPGCLGRIQALPPPGSSELLRVTQSRLARPLVTPGLAVAPGQERQREGLGRPRSLSPELVNYPGS